MIFVANLVASPAAAGSNSPRHLRRFSTKLKTKLATKYGLMIPKLVPFQVARCDLYRILKSGVAPSRSVAPRERWNIGAYSLM